MLNIKQLIICLFMLLILSSCNNSSNVDTTTSYNLDSLPTLNEYNALPVSDINNIMEIILVASPKEIESTLSSYIETTLNEYEHLTLSEFSAFEDLLLISGTIKPLANYTVDVDILVDDSNLDASSRSALIEEARPAIFGAISGNNLLYFLRVNTINVSFTSLTSGISTGAATNNFISKGEILSNPNQNKDEILTQKLVADFLQMDINNIFRGFGIKNEGELYIEFSNTSMKNDDNIKEYSKELANLILENDESLNYLNKYNIKNISISYYAPWTNEDYITFNYQK